MRSLLHSRLLYFSGLFLAMFVWLANNSNPPTGRTGAPFDTAGTCANGCHTGNANNYNGDVTIGGLPATIQANTAYPLTITLTPTAGTPIKGGFQLVIVDGNNVGTGTLTAANAQSGTEMFGGRRYLEHRGGKIFGGNPVTWSFNWTSPPTASGNAIKIYYVGNFTNNNNDDSGDFVTAFLDTYPFAGPPAVTAEIVATTNVLCAGGNTGSATVEGAGGVPPFTYLWSNGQTTATATGLVAGNYSVTVAGSSGSGTATASTAITQPAALTASAVVANALSCTLNNTNVSANVGGGVSPYSYQWSNGNSGPVANYTVAGAGNVVVTDNNGCARTATFTIVSNVVPPVATTTPQGSISCLAPTATLSGAGSSAGANFTYQWTTTNGNIVSGATTLSPVVNAAGLYTLQVTNTSNSCTATATVTVTSNVAAPGASAAVSGPLTCTNGSIMLLGNSPTSGVTYIWRNAGGMVIANQQNATTSTPGVYTLTTTSSNGCTSTASVTAVANTTPPNATATGAAITCANPSVIIMGNSTTPNVTYAWVGPNNFTATLQNPTVSVAGTYTVTVAAAANGCTASATATVTENTLPPASGAANNGPLTCATTSVQLVGTTPVSNPIYLWSGPNNFAATTSTATTSVPGTYTVVITNPANGCTSSATTTLAQNITLPALAIAPPPALNCNTTTVVIDAGASSQGSNFMYAWSTTNGTIVSGGTTLTPVVSGAGTYTLAGTNTTNGCTAQATTVVVQTPAVTASIGNMANVSCNGAADGTATASPAGGNGVYTYLWSNNATTATLQGLAAGIYIVTVSDGQSCTATASATVTQPAVLTVNATATGQTAVNVNDGTATASPAGGTAPYTYLWNNGAITASITSLTPGIYTSTVTDANGCSAVQTVTVNSFGCTLSAAISTTNVTCNAAANGTATVSVAGANLPVSYVWSTNATTATVTDLAPGTVTVSITDANGCPATLNALITEPIALTVNATGTSPTTLTSNDGTATASPVGGTAPYLFLWNTGLTTASISGLAPGQYGVVVTDTNQCTATQNVTINALSCNLLATVVVVNAACAGSATGQATISVTGGATPYTYNWSNGAVVPVNVNLGADIYTVTSTDAAGCTVVQSVTIAEPSVLASLAQTTDVTCAGDQTGSVLIVSTGGTAPYTISGPVTGLSAGNYTNTVTDANNCFTTVSYTIVAKDTIAPTIACPGNISLCGADLVAYTLPVVSDNCGLGNNIPVLTSGLPSGAAFDDGITTQVFKVTDANGNTAQCSFTVTVFPLLDILVTSQNDVNNSGVGSIDATPIGGTAPYIYVWRKDNEFFSNEEDLTGLSAGAYLLNITDANGCSTSLAPVFISNTVGTSFIADNFSVRLFPNPASSTLHVQFNNLRGISAEIVDARGQLVQQVTASDLLNEISVAQLPAGLYCLKVLTAERGWQVTQWVKGE